MLSSLGRTARALLSISLLVTMLASGVVAPGSAAAQAQSIQSQLAGVTIGYGPPYVLDPDSSYADDVVETMFFTGTTDILAMGFLSPLIDLNGARDIMLEAMFGELGTTATIDRGDYAGVSYSLDMLNFDGNEIGVFSLFMNQRSHGFAEFYIYLAPPAVFGSSMQAAQGAFTIDGKPLMDGVDAIAMGNMVTANIGITGGTAVTDVTDVADQPEETAVATEVATQPNTSATSADVQAYIDTLTSQRAEFSDTFITFDDALKQFGSETATDEQKQVALQSMVDMASQWITYNDRAAAVAAPAGMESLHAEYLEWADNITTMGTLFLGAIQQQGPTLEGFFAQVAVVVDDDATFAKTLAAAGDAQTGSTTSTTSVPDTTNSSAEADAYLGTLIEHRNEYVQSLVSFTTALGVIGDASSTDADKQAAVQTTVDIATAWFGYKDRAAQVAPPAGMEDVHALYLTWSDQISTMGALFMGFATQQGPTLEDVLAQLDLVQVTDASFSDLLSSTSASLGSGNSSTTAETPVGTEASSGSSRTTRTTRGSDTAETPEATEASGGTTRTTRTTRGSDTAETPEATEASSGTSRTTRDPNKTPTGNTSETKGRTGTTTTTGAAAGSEWVTPINQATITWGEGFDLNPNIDEPQSSDEESSEDRLRLVWTNASGNPVGISLTVLPNQYVDSSNLVSLLSSDPQTVQDIFGADAIAVDSVVDGEASAILIYAVDDQGEFYSYIQMSCVTEDCSTLAMLVISADAADVVEVLDATETGIAVNGVPVSGVFSSSEVQAAIDAFGS